MLKNPGPLNLPSALMAYGKADRAVQKEYPLAKDIRRNELTIGVVLAGIVAGVALIWSDPSNKGLILVGSSIFLCLLFVKPEKVLLAYLVFCPVLDQFVHLFGKGIFGPQILVRGGLLMVVAFYWFANIDNMRFYRSARPILLLSAMLAMSAIVFAGNRDSRQEIAALSKITSWIFLTLTIADMVMQGKMKMKHIYLSVMLAFLISIVSLLGADLIGINVRGRYGLGEISGAFAAPHGIAIGLSICIMIAIAIATRHRNTFVVLFLLFLCVLGLAAILRTYIRSGYVVFLAGIFMLHLMLWRYRKYKGARRQRVILAVISLIFAGVIVIYSILNIDVMEERFGDFSGSGRTTVWLVALEYYGDYPIFAKLLGGGYSSAGRFYHDTFTGTHNTFLLFLLYGGLLGLFLYLWIFVSLWREIKPSDQSDYLPSVIAGTTIVTFLVAEMVNGAIFHMSTVTYFAFVVGGAIGFYKIKAGSKYSDGTYVNSME